MWLHSSSEWNYEWLVLQRVDRTLPLQQLFQTSYNTTKRSKKQIKTNKIREDDIFFLFFWSIFGGTTTFFFFSLRSGRRKIVKQAPSFCGATTTQPTAHTERRPGILCVPYSSTAAQQAGTHHNLQSTPTVQHNVRGLQPKLTSSFPLWLSNNCRSAPRKKFECVLYLPSNFPFYIGHSKITSLSSFLE